VLTTIGSGLSALAIAVPGRVRAQGVPGGTLRIVIGYAPGGGTDVIVRQMADKLKDRLNANVLIENRPGASGMLAPVAMKTAPADGSVILFTPGVSTVEQKVTKKTIPFDLDHDLLPITLAGTVPTVYVVSAAIGVKTLAEYTAWIKANPKQANFGTAAMGSNTHFFGVELGQAIGQPLQPVAYKGTGPLLTDIMAGHRFCSITARARSTSLRCRRRSAPALRPICRRSQTWVTQSLPVKASMLFMRPRARQPR
jgi:tripartite-type tricarboxylate transporter receptor subunit TctC